MKPLTIQEMLSTFSRKLGSFVSPKTKEIYIKVADSILNGKQIEECKSKSDYRQYVAVAKRLNELNFTNIKIIKWTRRGDGGRLEKINEKIITIEEFEKLLQSCPASTKGNELKLALKIAYYGGLRLFEVLKLKKSNIIIKDHIILRILGKGEKSRKAYLPLSMLKEIQSFTNFSISYTYIRGTLAYISKKALGKHINFHALRHNFASNYLNNGGNIVKLQHLLGHSDISTTAIYTHLINDVDSALLQMGY